MDRACRRACWFDLLIGLAVCFVARQPVRLERSRRGSTQQVQRDRGPLLGGGGAARQSGTYSPRRVRARQRPVSTLCAAAASGCSWGCFLLQPAAGGVCYPRGALCSRMYSSRPPPLAVPKCSSVRLSVRLSDFLQLHLRLQHHNSLLASPSRAEQRLERRFVAPVKRPRLCFEHPSLPSVLLWLVCVTRLPVPISFFVSLLLPDSLHSSSVLNLSLSASTATATARSARRQRGHRFPGLLSASLRSASPASPNDLLRQLSAEVSNVGLPSPAHAREPHRQDPAVLSID